MNQTRYIELFSNPDSVRLSDIPVLDYPAFLAFLDQLMGEEGTHCVAYFALPQAETFRFICCMAADENHALVIFSHEQPRNPLPSLPSITARHFQFHVFEREIFENTGIKFPDHPWLKPVRFPFQRADHSNIIDNYPFYSIEGEELHEVGVGPIHAGIIEPGYFRFICHGEEVLHLEIQLGFQHRGIEHLFVENQQLLYQSILAENITGDTAIGHSLAFTGVVESLAGIHVSSSLAIERTVALELERIAVHIGDTAALCTDIAYQFGQVVNEALRTIVINTTQLWCGNRFGKGLIRPSKTNYPLSLDIVKVILKNLEEVEKRYLQVTDRIFTLSSVLGRFENMGKLTPKQATLIGTVGMAARSSGMYRDIRWSHPFSAFTDHPYEPAMLQKGDVWSRALLRKLEVEKSIEIIRKLLKNFMIDHSEFQNYETVNQKSNIINSGLAPLSLAISLVEGWRGEICHVAVTDNSGKMAFYKIKDPSLHNWMALALAVRNQEISDFPLCNKSFNLSYCGNDL
ncbi:MAG: NADH-quinone oxidoreductase subunit C [Bacteroidales bacterium]|nr:NADH-quinone oxidoreductase subunit C [Bacteroidales bacterium]